MLGRIEPEVADRVVHLLRAGGAIEADHIHVEGFERGERRADFGAEQHGARWLRSVTCTVTGRRLPAFCMASKMPTSHGFGLQQILAGFDQQHIDAAFDQGGGLLVVAGHHVVEGDVSERRQLGGRPDRSRHEARLVFGRKLLRDFFRNLRRGDVDLRDLVLQIVLGQHHAGRRRRCWSRPRRSRP